MKKIEKLAKSDSLVKCNCCKQQVPANKAMSLLDNFYIDDWICNKCSEKLFLKASDLPFYAIYHDNQLPDFDSKLYAERREKVKLVRRIIKSNDWEPIKFIRFNKKTLEIVMTDDPVICSKTLLTEKKGFGEIVKIEEVVSTKINYSWCHTDLEFNQADLAYKNRNSMGKRMAVGYELLGTPGLVYEASKDTTGPTTESRIRGANLAIFLKDGTTVNYFVNVPLGCDKGTPTFNKFTNDCQFVMDFIAKVYNENFKTPSVSETNDLSQLSELKKLLDEGVITEDEFNQKKKQILKL